MKRYELEVSSSLPHTGRKSWQVCVVTNNYAVGSGAECDLFLPGDEGLGGRHFTIFWAGSRVYLSDLGTGIGTFVNGKRINNTCVRLGKRHQDEIIAGNTKIIFRLINGKKRKGKYPGPKGRRLGRRSGSKTRQASSSGWRENEDKKLERRLPWFFGIFEMSGGRKDEWNERSSDELRRELVKPGTNAEVQFAAFTDHEITLGSTFILDVWAYTHDTFGQVIETLQHLKRDKMLGVKAGVKITEGSLVTCKLSVPSLIVEEPVDSFLWNGVPSNVGFIVEVPKELNSNQIGGKVDILIDGMHFGKIAIAFSVGTTETPVMFARVQRNQAAFASYASDDRQAVLARIQGMQKVAPEMDIFVDVLELRSGANWLDEITKRIPDIDAFYLFWSRPAATSKWVEQEWRLALESKGLEVIDPVPLEDPEVAPPPEELSSLHFRDRYLDYAKYEELKRRDS